MFFGVVACTVQIFRCLRVGRTVQYSEDSEAGEGQKKRFRVSRGEEEETEAGSGGVKVKKKKKKKKSWNDQEPSTSHSLEVGLLEMHVLIMAAVLICHCSSKLMKFFVFFVAFSAEGEAWPRL